jgi:phage terminase small subunit
MNKKAITGMTDMQMRFVDEFMKTGNKKQALLNSGYKGKGKSSTITSYANKIYNNPKVIAEIEKRRKDLRKANIVDAEKIVERLTKMFNGELTCERVYKDGEIIEEPISFKNQIEAAKVLVNILGIQAQLQKQPEEKKEVEKMAEDMKAMMREFMGGRKSKVQTIAQDAEEISDED